MTTWDDTSMQLQLLPGTNDNSSGATNTNGLVTDGSATSSNVPGVSPLSVDDVTAVGAEGVHVSTEVPNSDQQTHENHVDDVLSHFMAESIPNTNQQMMIIQPTPMSGSTVSMEPEHFFLGTNAGPQGPHTTTSLNTTAGMSRTEGKSHQPQQPADAFAPIEIMSPDGEKIMNGRSPLESGQERKDPLPQQLFSDQQMNVVQNANPIVINSLDANQYVPTGNGNNHSEGIVNRVGQGDEGQSNLLSSSYQASASHPSKKRTLLLPGQPPYKRPTFSNGGFQGGPSDGFIVQSQQQQQQGYPTHPRSHFARAQMPQVTSVPAPMVMIPQQKPPQNSQMTWNPSVTTPDGKFYIDEPYFMPDPPNFVPTWGQLTETEKIPFNPVAQPIYRNGGVRLYQLSLLNVTEFTISGLPIRFDGLRTSLSGLRKDIKAISRDYGKAVYEKDPEHEEGGKWRIPLGAYQAFYTWLRSQPNTRVEAIPNNQLKIASLGKARLEKGYPSSERLMKIGVPRALAETLVPFQRGGVEFVYEKDGRALIADEMGLGKTIQSIASMAIYQQEWPVLILTPSGARYHWESEFLQWLGVEKSHSSSEKMKGAVGETSNGNDALNTKEDTEPAVYAGDTMDPLLPHQVNVLTSSRDVLLPRADTRVVICSYGLAPALAKAGVMNPGTFRCAIVDESHMLKNKKSKRTQNLAPILRATTRCILLSGTPAFARPMELWPQLHILGTERFGWGTTETDFVRKYVKGSRQNRAELYAMLTGTVMIRRLKNDILKALQKKHRELMTVTLLDDSTRKDFQLRIEQLRQGKGALGKIAKTVTAMSTNVNGDEELCFRPGSVAERSSERAKSKGKGKSKAEAPVDEKQLQEQVTQEMKELYSSGLQDIEHALNTTRYSLDGPAMDALVNDMKRSLDQRCSVYYTERLSTLLAAAKSGDIEGEPGKQVDDDEKNSRRSALTQLYKMTGNVKVPLVLDMLEKWLANPAKGKLCIFAHHLSVLDALEKQSTICNDKDSLKKFIRIDGSTGPKVRQEQINAFQNDPTVRIALLGITAAGVAVTLTASSNVWFAEMFWTPALMIQAEDRVHRIGQQARVKCLYLVARGTLDEILWKHVEKKFQDLGEFVEGKEKMKIVVNKKFKNYAEYKSSLEVDMLVSDDEDDELEEQLTSEDGGVDEELLHEIEELGKEEEEMLRHVDGEDADDNDGDSKPSSQRQLRKPAPPVAGSTEAEAICLSDDEEPEPSSQSSAAPSSQSSVVDPSDNNSKHEEQLITYDNLRTQKFKNFRCYKLHFTGPRYGLEIVTFFDRIIVQNRSEERVKKFGQESRPKVGDILLAVNGQPVPFGIPFKDIMNHLMVQMKRPPVELMFGMHNGLAHFFRNTDLKEAQEAQNTAIYKIIHKMKEMQVTFNNAEFGFELMLHEGYLVTTKPVENGKDPRAGDVLIGINDQLIPRNTVINNVVQRIKSMGFPLTLRFKRDDAFASFIHKAQLRRMKQRLARRREAKAAREAAKGAASKKAAPDDSEVIEIE